MVDTKLGADVKLLETENFSKDESFVINSIILAPKISQKLDKFLK